MAKAGDEINRTMQRVRAAALVFAVAGSALIAPFGSHVHTAHAASNVIPGLTDPQLSVTDPSVNKTYVAGTGNIAVIDNTTDQLLSYIPAPSVDATRWVQFFVNPPLHRVYAVSGGRVFSIDTTTDAVVNEAAYNIAGLPVYDPTTDTIYAEVASAFGVTPSFMNLTVIDGATLTTIDSFSSVFTQVPGSPRAASSS